MLAGQRAEADRRGGPPSRRGPGQRADRAARRLGDDRPPRPRRRSPQPGSLEKVHGGATLARRPQRRRARASRPSRTASSTEKEAIARAARRLVEPGPGDRASPPARRPGGSRTTSRQIPDLTVVTNSIQVANVLHPRRPARPHRRAHGRRAHARRTRSSGRSPMHDAPSLHVDVLFMGVHGMSEDAGLHDAEPARGRDRRGARSPRRSARRRRRPHEVGRPRA